MTTGIKELDCSVDLLRVILWQDENAENLRGLLELKQQWYEENHCQFWKDWYRDVFDLNTANDFGLRVWSEILDLPLFATNQPSPDDYPAWGFDSDTNRNFDNGNFAVDENSAFLLTTEQRRIILKLRYFQLITRGAIPEINRFLATLFGDGFIYALDGLDMTMVYVNTERLPAELRRAIVDLDLLPRPAGVKIRYVDGSLLSWGFDSDSNQNFDNGNFIGG